MRLLVLFSLLLGMVAIPAQFPQHAVATINDPRSHGQIGDNFLSLNEAILLHNRQLNTSQLSATEQLQISFIGGDIALADIDTTQVQTVTLERDLDPIINLPHGFNVRASPFIGTIDIGTTNGFLVDSDFCDFRRVVIRGGTTAIRVAQRDTFYGSTFEGVRFEGQTVSAVHVYLVNNDGETRLSFEGCTFVNLPTAVRIDDLGLNRRGEILMRGCLFDGGNEGFVLNLGGGATPGTRYNLRLDRSTFQNQTIAGLMVRRLSPLADREVVLDLFDMVSRNVPIGVWVDGHPTARTEALVRMADLTGSTTSLWLGGPGTNTTIAVQDSTFAGGLGLSGKTTVALDNVRQVGGALALDTAAGTTLTVTQSAFNNVTAAVTGGSAAAFSECRFDGGTIRGTTTALVAISNSYTSTLSLGQNATATASIPNAQLGSTRVTQQEVPVGQNVDLDHDLPPGFFGFWLFGLGKDDPTLQVGLRLYIEPATFYVYPGVWRGQGRVPFPTPNSTALRGLNLVMQMLVGHDVGIRGPRLQLAPGGRVTLR